MKIYGFVPAKGTSERVSSKNMRFLGGERLYIRALKTLCACREIDTVFLDTESEEMFEMANYLPIKFMKRDPELANNQTDGHQMFMNEVRKNPKADIYVQLLCTSPFVHPETIDNAIHILKESDEYDSAILMGKDKFYLWEDGKPTYDIEHIPNSKDLPDTVMESMGLYIVKKEAAISCQKRYGKKALLIFGDQEEMIDINTSDDLRFANIYAKGLKSEENAKFNMIKNFISSPALSDLLDDMKIEKGETCGTVISGWICNVKGRTILGRANTLRIRALKKGEDFQGIYDALQSYQGVAENDVIVVENELKDFAYFGDLNARLALRSGACAAVIDGATRDPKATKFVNFPVFSRKYSATDVRRRATLDYINKPIKIDEVVICPGDLIFIDECSMVVIYQKYEKEIIERVLNTAKTEKEIVNDILDGKEVNDIIKKNGAF